MASELYPNESNPHSGELWKKSAAAVAGAGVALALAGCAKAASPAPQESTTPAVLGGEPMGPVPDDVEPVSKIATPEKIKAMTNQEVLDLFKIDRDGLNSSNLNWKYEWFEERGSAPNVIDGGWFLDENTPDKTELDGPEGGYGGHAMNLELADPTNPDGPKIRPVGQLGLNLTILANTIQANREYFVDNGRSPEAEDILLAGTENILRDIDLLDRQCDDKCPDIFASDVTNNLINYVLSQPQDNVFESADICGIYSTSIPGVGTGTDLCIRTRSVDGNSTIDGFKLTGTQVQLYPTDSQYMNAYDRYADGSMAVMQIPLSSTLDTVDDIDQ